MMLKMLFVDYPNPFDPVMRINHDPPEDGMGVNELIRKSVRGIFVEDYCWILHQDPEILKLVSKK